MIVMAAVLCSCMQ